MTNSRFLEELAERAKLHGFEQTAFGEIREKKTGCCPIVAVWHRTKNFTETMHADNHCWDMCASDLELEQKWAEQIALAADGHHTTHPVLTDARNELEFTLGMKND